MTTAQGTRTRKTKQELLSLSVAGAGASRSHFAVVEQFESARLIVREGDGYTLAHEALLSQWGRLRKWLADARADRELAEGIEADASKWTREGKDWALLRRKRRLLAAEDLQTRGVARLSEEARRFVVASRSAERRGFVLALVGASVLVIASATAVVVYVQTVRAAQARSDALATQAQDNATKANAEADRATKAESEAISNKQKADQATAQANEQKLQFSTDLVTLNKRLAELAAKGDAAGMLALGREIQAKQAALAGLTDPKTPPDAPPHPLQPDAPNVDVPQNMLQELGRPPATPPTVQSYRQASLSPAVLGKSAPTSRIART